MSGIKVCAKTENGQAVMRLVVHEAGTDERVMQRLGFVESVESDDPFCVVIERKRFARAFPVGHMQAMIVKKMSELGAVEGIDYDVEVL